MEHTTLNLVPGMHIHSGIPPKCVGMLLLRAQILRTTLALHAEEDSETGSSDGSLFWFKGRTKKSVISFVPDASTATCSLISPWWIFMPVEFAVSDPCSSCFNEWRIFFLGPNAVTPNVHKS